MMALFLSEPVNVPQVEQRTGSMLREGIAIIVAACRPLLQDACRAWTAYLRALTPHPLPHFRTTFTDSVEKEDHLDIEGVVERWTRSYRNAWIAYRAFTLPPLPHLRTSL